MMVPKFFLIPLAILVTALAVFLAACQPAPAAPTASLCQTRLPYTVSRTAGAWNCGQDAAGGVAGICVFPDGSECDEWAYFRGECAPTGASPTAPPLVTVPPEPTEQQPAGGWQLYRNDELGYRFEYPPDTVINTADNPLNSLAISGTDPPASSGRRSPSATPPTGKISALRRHASLEEWLAANTICCLMSASPIQPSPEQQPSMSAMNARRSPMPSIATTLPMPVSFTK